MDISPYNLITNYQELSNQESDIINLKHNLHTIIPSATLYGLPKELRLEIFTQLPLEDIVTCSKVCRIWHKYMQVENSQEEPYREWFKTIHQVKRMLKNQCFIGKVTSELIQNYFQQNSVDSLSVLSKWLGSMSQLIFKLTVTEDVYEPPYFHVSPLTLEELTTKTNAYSSQLKFTPEHEEIDLNDTELTHLSKEIYSLTKLEQLYLNDNQLTKLSVEFGNFSALKKLNLQGNKLVSLPAEMGNLLNLKEICLNENKLTSLPKEMGKLTNLKELLIRNNKLVSIPEEVNRLISLVRLDLSQNQITFLPAQMHQLTNLKKLNLSQNHLINLPIEMGRMTQLTTIDLRNNLFVSKPMATQRLMDNYVIVKFDNWQHESSWSTIAPFLECFYSCT